MRSVFCNPRQVNADLFFDRIDVFRMPASFLLKENAIVRTNEGQNISAGFGDVYGSDGI